MRLIRLYKDYEAQIPLGRVANFNNNFQSDLVLPPNSQIALQSIAIDAVDPQFTIDDENNLVEWSLEQYEEHQFLIQPGDYNSSNSQILFDHLTNGFNASTGFGWTDASLLLKIYLGVEWQVQLDITRSSKLEIGYKIGNLYWPYAPNTVAAENVETEEVDENRETVALVAPDNDYGSVTLEKSIINRKYISKGCGCVRAQGMVIIDNTNVGSYGQGFLVGLIESSTTDPDNLVLADIKYGIHYTIFNTGQRKYHVILDGVRSTSSTLNAGYTQEDVTNDIQEVMINDNEIYFNIYQNGVDEPVRLNDDAGIALPNSGRVTYNGQKLYPVLVFFSGDDYVSVDNWICTESPYQLKPTLPGDYYPDFGHALQPVPKDANTSLSEISENFLEFKTNAIAEFLGFDERENGIYESGPTSAENGTSRNFTFESDKKFNPLYYADSFLVELRNIALDSYDGLKEARKNILAYISHSDGDGTFNYEVNTPVFVDLHNKKELLLRNLEANLLYGDYSEFAIQSDASMVLLIKEKGE